MKAGFIAFGFSGIVMPKARTPTKARVAAAGFFALDIVFGIDDMVPRFYAGGTCGNVVERTGPVIASARNLVWLAAYWAEGAK